jgi:predicted cation transporter
VPNFNKVLKTLATLTILSAILAVTLAVLNAFIPIPYADQIIQRFMESFSVGVGAIIGLLGGRALTIRRR